MATWIHRVSPDTELPGGASPYHNLFGRDARSHLDAVTPALDDNSLGQGLERTVADQKRMTREILAYRHAACNRRRERRNARVVRESPGAQAAAGDRVLVKEPATTLNRDNHHPKLAHDHYTGLWKITGVISEGLSFTDQLNGCRVRQRRVAAAGLKL